MNPLVLLLCLLPAAAQLAIPPVACTGHSDCVSKRELIRTIGQTPTICERGVCASVIPLKNCSAINDCGWHRTCVAGRCALGGLGAPCRTDSANCMPGFTCDPASAMCIRGVAGALCRAPDECGFGYGCALTSLERGTCRLGVEGSSFCRIDAHCAGPLRCFRFPLYELNLLYRCGLPADALPAPLPETFGKCETAIDCGAVCGRAKGCRGSRSVGTFECVRGACRPENLGQPCLLGLVQGRRHCGTYSTCQKGRCALSGVGSPCRVIDSLRLNDQCPPGTQCRKTCVVGTEGMACADGRECKLGLVCGSNKKCVQSARGQPCASDFWCPTGLRCDASKTCVPGPGAPNAPRARKCRFTTDCGEQVPCINGLCLPPPLGEKCQGVSVCGVGVPCVDGVCKPPNVGKECFVNDDCGPGTACQIGRYPPGNCVPPIFHQRCADPAGGTACVGGVRVEGTKGRKCSDVNDCFFGMACRDGVCTASKIGDVCRQQYHCPKEGICSVEEPNAGKCVRPSRGGPCENSLQCPEKMRCSPYGVNIFASAQDEGRCGAVL